MPAFADISKVDIKNSDVAMTTDNPPVAKEISQAGIICVIRDEDAVKAYFGDRRSWEIASQARALFPAALTRPRALRVPQLSLEAHARELFGAGPLGCARPGSRAVLAARDLPLGDPHGQAGGAPGSTHPETWRKQTRGDPASLSGLTRGGNGGGAAEGAGPMEKSRRKGRGL